MPLDCELKCGRRAAMKRPKTSQALCQPCFFAAFEDEIHETIVAGRLFKEGDYVAVAASGGKDSTVLAYTMKLLNARHNYGLKLVLLSVDEGITGYRDDSLETVKRNEQEYEIPLKILSYKELYGWTMDEIVAEVGRKSNCTFCGVFRRQALDRGAAMLGVDKIVTGHNADDVAETILMNLLRGDVARLRRCTAITTGSEGSLPRCKPFKYTYEKEIVMYAYYKKLDYFSTECLYSPNAYRGHVRTLIKDLERIRPASIVDIIHSGESLSIREGVKMPTQGTCSRCNYISSQEVCKACVLLEGLNKGLPRLGIGKSSKVKGQLKTLEEGCGKNSEEGCCGGGSCASKKPTPETTTAKVKSRRFEKKQKRIQERKMSREASSTSLEHDSVEDNNNYELDLDEEGGIGEFLGCGGFIKDDGLIDDDEVGTIQSKVDANLDIENLGQLASSILRLKGAL